MYQTTTEIAIAYEVVYNLSEYTEGSGLYIPSAYIVSLDKGGLLAHIRQKALPETVGSFDLELDATRARMFEIIEALQPKALEKKFSPPKKKVKALEVLLEDTTIKRSIYSFAHRLLDEFLGQIAKHNYPLTWEVERKVLVKDFLMQVASETLVPDLSFRKTEDSVYYNLKLTEGDRAWNVQSRNVIPITNHPAWLFVDYCLYRVVNINGNMVKPFRLRDEVRIPQKQVKTYFQKFILKVAARQDIQAEGFDVVEYEELKGCTLRIQRSLFDDKLALNVYLQYPHAEFVWNDRKDKRTTLEFEEEEVRILHILRDRDAEHLFLEKLTDFGLKKNQQEAYFVLGEEPEDEFALLEWLIDSRKKLEAVGFTVETTQLEDQQLYLHKADLKLESARENDWFDVYGMVEVGEFSFPFMKLARHIRDGKRVFTLPNGEGFLIPLEWFTKYRALVQFAEKDGEQLRLQKSQFTILQEIGISEDTQVTDKLEEIDFTPSKKLRADLRPYQLEGAKWLVQLYRNDLGGCLADDMGLGKTLQTITVLLHAKEQKVKQAEEKATLEKLDDKSDQQLDLFNGVGADEDFLAPLNAIVILPASLVFNWESELKKFAPGLTVYKHVGPKRQKDPRILRRFDVVLTTYQTALRDVSFLEEITYEYIVLDESQQIKNRESKVFKAINSLEAHHKISLSGTPIENSLSDLWSQMQFINPNLLGSFSFFKREFITPIEKYQDEAKKDRLRGLVAPYLLRRTKDEVAGDLPPLTTKIFYSEMTPEQKRLYEREKSAARNYLLENFEADNPKYRILVLQSLTKLRQLVNHPRMVKPEYQKESGKFQDIMEHWNVIRRSGHKALFFSSFVQYLNIFKEQFVAEKQQFAWLTGDLTGKERQQQIMRFEQEKTVESFLISIKSGGTGLNLTAADYVFILDPWWNPTTEQQAIARAHRIGQEKNVIAVKFITRDSIEEKILKLQERKSRLAEDIIDNVRKSDLSRGDIEYLLE